MLRDFYNNHKRTIFISLIALILVITAVIIYYTFFLFHITSISPDPSRASYQTPRLVIAFNKDLVKDSLKISSKDGLTIETSLDNSTATVSILSAMQPGYKYTFVIESIDSVNGDTIKDYTIILKTSKDGILSKEDEQIILDRQEKSKPEYFSDPIFKHVPYSTLDFSITAGINVNTGEGDKKITIFITAQLSAADVRIDRLGTIARYNQKAMDYLTSLKDISVDNYNYSYKINETSP